jgi:NADH-quinone oxidoreductase subunit N
MHFDSSNLIPVLPEIFILSMVCLIMILDLFLEESQRQTTYLLSQVSLAVTIFLILLVSSSETQIVFDGSYIRDPMSDGLKVFICLISMAAFVYSKEYLLKHEQFRGDFFVLGLFAILGMMVMVSSASFLTIYLGLELLSLSLYALVAFNRDSKTGSEAAMKYFMLGAIASGMLLYGISMIYGATGHIGFSEVASAVATSGTNNTVLVFGVVFLVIGLAFKLGAVPFHMWMPDVYHGAPTPVAMFIGSAPKLAAFALAIRMLVDGLEGIHSDWQGMLVILAVLSMAVGNVVAIAQTNIKRMLAYSTISHVGFIMLGILAGTNEGYVSSMFYAITYGIMAVGSFGIIIAFSSKGFEAENLEDYKGLHEKSPWFALMMLFVMFSMAGVPPTVGFFAKLFVLDSIISVGMTNIALIGVFFSIIGAFYYIRIIKLMYFDKPVDDTTFEPSIDTKVVLSVNGLSLLILGLFPATLLSVCTAAFG